MIYEFAMDTLALPARSPNLNAFAERWVRSVRQECLSKLILFGPDPLWRVLKEYCAHYHTERNHQGKGNLILFPGTRGKKEPPRARYTASIDSEGYSSTTNVPHEYFDLTPRVSCTSNYTRLTSPTANYCGFSIDITKLEDALGSDSDIVIQAGHSVTPFVDDLTVSHDRESAAGDTVESHLANTLSVCYLRSQ